MEESRVTHIEKCRICGEVHLDEVIDFGTVCLGNDLGDSFEKSISAPQYPLVLVCCAKCGHFSLLHEVNPQVLFSDKYSYLSSTGASYRAHLEETFMKLSGDWGLETKSCRVLEIGSNDGCALSFWGHAGYEILGVEPTLQPALMALKSKIPTLKEFFTSQLAATIRKSHGEFGLVFSFNVMAHVSDLHDVMKGAHTVLGCGGLLVFDVGDFEVCLQRGIFDTVYHEHLDYHTERSMRALTTAHGFDVLRVERHSSQGGSLRIIAKKRPASDVDVKGCKSDLGPQNLNIDEYIRLIHHRRDSVAEKVSECLGRGGKIFGYGAPTKAVLAIKLFGLEGKISCLFEDNPIKIGKYLPQFGIPIVAFDRDIIAGNDLVIVFAWNFFGDISERLEKSGSKAELLNWMNYEI